jgi:flagellar basal-body rod protein FlgF
VDHLVYVSASGASESMLAQAANSHNLANASTVGFRADLMMAQQAGESAQRLQSRAYAGMQNTGFDFKEGAVNSTGRDLDVAIQGSGWMAVQTPDGGEAYTRRGDLRVNELGQITNGAGQALIGNSGPIALPPFSSINIGADGTISIVPVGESPSTLAVVDRVKLVNPERALLTKGENGMIQLPEGEVAAADAAVKLISGSLESSNVDSVSAMVHMIELARGFENHIKMTKIAEQLDAASTELMSFS